MKIIFDNYLIPLYLKYNAGNICSTECSSVHKTRNEQKIITREKYLLTAMYRLASVGGDSEKTNNNKRFFQ